MKPTESSEEGHGRAVEGGLQSGGLAVAPVLDPATQAPERTEPSDGRDVGGHSDAPVRSVSGVVAASPPSADQGGREQDGHEQDGHELEEAHTTVDAGPARRFAASQAALSHRIRNALDQTLPLGTPAPDASLFAEARAQRVNYSRTMLLGGRYLAELGAAPEPPTRRAEPPQTEEVVTPRAAELPATQRMPPGVAGLTPVPAQAAAPAQAALAQTPSPEARASQATATQVSRQAAPSDVAPQQEEGVLRASFVRSVGPPTAPPPRRRRTLPPGEGPPGEGTPAGGFWPEDAAEGAGPEAPAVGQAARLDRSGEEPDHEAFALDRPRASAVPPPAAEASPRMLAVGATTAVSSGNTGRGSAVPFVKAPDARNPRSSILSNSVILPPPPQPHDFELPSSPPPSLAFAPTARAPSLAPATAVDAWPASSGAASGGSAGKSPRVSGAVASAARGAGVPATRGAALPTTRPPARPTAALLDLPTADPLAGYEAPRETFWQRSLIVFVVALAVVGLFALGAIAFGFLGKTGW